MRLILATFALAASAFAGYNPTPKAKSPGTLLTGCPNGYADFVTGECKPFHLRVRDAATGDWRSHKVVDAYPVIDHFPARPDGKDKAHPVGGKGKFGHGMPGGPSEHCPNGVAAHATGECKPFRVHVRDAESGEWREHRVTGAYRIPDEKAGMKGAFGGVRGHDDEDHREDGAKVGPRKGGFFGGPKGGMEGKKGAW